MNVFVIIMLSLVVFGGLVCIFLLCVLSSIATDISKQLETQGRTLSRILKKEPGTDVSEVAAELKGHISILAKLAADAIESLDKRTSWLDSVDDTLREAVRGIKPEDTPGYMGHNGNGRGEDGEG